MIGPVTRVNLINQLLVIQSHVESQILTRKDDSGESELWLSRVPRTSCGQNGMLTWLPNGNSNNFRLT